VSDQRKVQARVVGDYFPAWCRAQKTAVDASTFDPDWSFLTPGMAQWFARAVDEGVVEIKDGWPTLPDGRHTYLFEKGGGRARVYREGFLEVAAAGLLARRYGWSPERLKFQSAALGRSGAWTFDLLAYADGAQDGVAIAADAKWRQRDAIKLVHTLEVCGRRGDHDEADCDARKDDHRKYVGLVEFRPRLLWVIGPDAFADKGPDLVFTVEIQSEGRVRLFRTQPDELRVG